MIKKHGQFILGLLNQLCNIFIPFVITFIGLKYLPVDVGGIWVIFLSMVVLINLFDFGLSPTIIRNVSYVVAGAQKLVRQGINGVQFDKNISYELLSRLIYDIKKIYRIITLIAFVLICLGGGAYFYYIAPRNIEHQVVIAWFVFSTGLVINLYYLYYTPILTGLGVIQYSYLSNILGRIIWLLLCLIFYKYNSSILMYAVTFLVSILVNRFVSIYFYRKNHHIVKTCDVRRDEISTIPFIATNAIKLGVVSLGAFLINRATVLIAGMALSIIDAGQFTFTLQVYGAMVAISNVLLTTKIPELSQFVIQNKKNEIKSLIKHVLIISLGLYVFSFICFVLLSGELIRLTHARLGFLDLKYLLLLGGIFLLELNHSLCATILTTKNKVPFAIPAIVSGLLIVVLSLLLTEYLHLSVLGLILAQGIVQLLYNNWKWPYCVYKEFFKGTVSNGQ
jgi:O-antigen/teichoic acid export membrane protein